MASSANEKRPTLIKGRPLSHWHGIIRGLYPALRLTVPGDSRSAPKIALPKSRSRRYTPSSLVEYSRGANERRRNGEFLSYSLREYAPEETRRNRGSNSRVLLCAGVCGNTSTTRPPGRGTSLAGSSGYWVGHSNECFTVELMSDREPGLAPGSRGYNRSVRDRSRRGRASLRGTTKRTLFPCRPTSRNRRNVRD